MHLLLLCSPDISGLRAVTEDFTTFFGADLFAAFGNLQTLEAESVRWCTTCVTPPLTAYLRLPSAHPPACSDTGWCMPLTACPAGPPHPAPTHREDVRKGLNMSAKFMFVHPTQLVPTDQVVLQWV